MAESVNIMDLLQFYAVPKDTERAMLLFPTIEENLVIDLHVSLNKVQNGDTITFQFYMNDDATPFYSQDGVQLIDRKLAEEQPYGIAGEFVYFVDFSFEDFKDFGLMTIKLLINGKPQALYSKMFIQDGTK